jgi:pimeloyl-ACP methyl ester carboxylesterase
MDSTDRVSLSATSFGKGPNKPGHISDYESVRDTPHIPGLGLQKPQSVQALTIKVNDDHDGTVPGFLHIPAATSPPKGFAVILLSGAGGGVVGPSSIYLSIASKLSSLRTAIPVLRLDYRYPARNNYCVRDVIAAMDYLESKYAISKFILVGWSFGGAPVFTVGGTDSRVIGCATVASQSVETSGIEKLAPRPLLLLHGGADRILSPRCSEKLYEIYGPKGDRRIHVFDDDDHSLTKHAAEAEEMLCEFIAEVGDVEISEYDHENVVKRKLVEDGKRVEMMEKGGDLRGEEKLK